MIPSERRADLRIIAATNRDLEHEVAQGRFRRDLFERLNYVPVRIPPLRERAEDIPLLLRHALDQSDAGRWVEISSEAERCAAGTGLGVAGERAAPRAARGAVVAGRRGLAGQGRRDPGAARSRRWGGSGPHAADLSSGLPTLLEDAERGWLEQAMRQYPSLTRAELAERLKISESTLYKKLRQYGLVKN